MRRRSLRNILTYLRGRRRAFLSLLAAFLLFSVLPLLLLGGLALRFFLDDAEGRVRGAYLDRVAQAESDLSSQLDRIERGMEILALGSARLPMDGINERSIVTFDAIDAVQTLRDLMDAYRRSSPLIGSVYYLDADRRYVISADRSFTPVSAFHDTDWIGSLPAGRTDLLYLEPRTPLDRALQGAAALPPAMEEAGRSLVLTAVMPLEGLAVSSAGWFAVNVDLRAVDAWLEGLPRAAGTDLLVADGGGRVLSGTGSAARDFALEPALLERSRAARESGRSGMYASGGSLSFVAGSDRGWIFAMRMPAREYYSFARRILGVLLALALPLSLAALAASAYVSDRIYHPVHRLLALIEEQGGGMPADAGEIAFIGDAFRGLRDLLAGNAQAVKESALRRLLAGDRVEPEAFLGQLARTGIRFPYRRYAVAVVLPLPAGGRPSAADSAVGQSLAVRAYESAPVGAAACGAALDMERIVLLLNADEEAGIRGLLGRVGGELASSLGVEPAAAVGRMYGSLEEAPQSFAEARTALEEWIPEGGDRIVFYRPVPVGDARPRYPYAVEEALIRAVKRNDRERAGRLVDEFVSELASTGSPGRARIEIHVLSLLSGLMRATGSLDGAGGDASGGNWPRVFLRQDVGIDAVGPWIRGFLDGIMDGREGRTRETGYRDHIAEYLRGNYRRDISLEDVADWAGISYSYLRKIFHDLFGCTFLEYLHSIRVEAVKERLREGNERVADIAASAGYPNVARLNRNFRRIVGCMPSEYRRRARGSLLE